MAGFLFSINVYKFGLYRNHSKLIEDFKSWHYLFVQILNFFCFPFRDLAWVAIHYLISSIP